MGEWPGGKFPRGYRAISRGVDSQTRAAQIPSTFAVPENVSFLVTARLCHFLFPSPPYGSPTSPPYGAGVGRDDRIWASLFVPQRGGDARCASSQRSLRVSGVIPARP